jgi:hypothetical protein
MTTVAADAPVLQAHDNPIVFSFPHLDRQLRDEAHAKHNRHAAAALAALAGGVNAPPPASTNGWDTVFAIRVPDVNNAIAKQKTSPKTFSLSQPLGPNSNLKGVFSDWRIVTGADGENMNVLIPVPSGVFSFNGLDYDLTGAQITAMYHLDVIPPNPPATTPTKTGTNHQLVVSDKQANPNVPIVSVTLTVVPPSTYAKWPQGISPTAVMALIGSAMQIYLNANVSAFTQTFAAVDLNIMADAEGLQWLSPAYTSYAFADGGSDQNSFFGVLTLTGDIGRAANLKHELAASAIPTNQRSAFLISQQLFLANSIFPSLPHSFQNATTSDFQLTNNNTEIINNGSGKVKLDPVRYGLIDYTPYLESFDLLIDTTEIHTRLEVRVEISPGIVTYIDIDTYHGLKLEQKTDGNQTIGFDETRPYTATHRVETSPGVIVTEVIAGIIVSVVGLAVGKIADTLAKRIIIAIIVAVIAGIITAIQLIITEVIANGVAASMPEIDPLVQTGTNPITWPTQKSKFTITAVQLNESVQLSGDPGFA